MKIGTYQIGGNKNCFDIFKVYPDQSFIRKIHITYPNFLIKLLYRPWRYKLQMQNVIENTKIWLSNFLPHGIYVYITAPPHLTWLLKDFKEKILVSGNRLFYTQDPIILEKECRLHEQVAIIRLRFDLGGPDREIVIGSDLKFELDENLDLRGY